MARLDGVVIGYNEEAMERIERLFLTLDGLQAGILAEMVRNARSWNPVGARG